MTPDTPFSITLQMMRRMLVVEDNPNIAELLRIWFDPHGWQIAVATNGIRALVQVNRFRPAVVLMDVMLPGLDGFEVLRRIRREQPTLPVILCTARDSPEERAAGLAAGADDYFVKPWSLTRLESRVEELTSYASRTPDRTIDRAAGS